MTIRSIGGALGLLLAASAFAQPTDDCASAPTVTAGDTLFDTTGATNDGTGNCGLSAVSADVWVKYVPPTSGSATFETCAGASFDTVLSAFDGCGGTELACNDDSCGLRSRIRVSVTAGQPVYIRIAGFNSQIGTGTLTVLDPAPPPTNDLCADAITVTGGTTINFNLSSASNDGSSTCNTGDLADVWYRYVAPSTGVSVIDACNSANFVNLSAFDACGGAELGCAFGCELRLSLTAGQVIYLRVASDFDPGLGEVIINDPVPAPANDNCANAAVVTSGSSTSFDTTAASDDGSSTCAGDNSPDVWFSYTPTAAGEVTIETCGSSYDTVLTVFDGCNGTQQNCNDDNCGLQSSITRTVAAGSTYIIRVGGFGGTSGSGTLTISDVTPVSGWDETIDGEGDAGDVPDSAQVVSGRGELNRISGQLDAGSADMFRINVCDTATFNATMVGGATFDTQLWLFNTDGTGVTFNDDSTGLLSTITNQFVTATGDYLLALSGYNYDATDSSGQLIWISTPFNVERQPDGPGAANPVAGWFGGSGGGSYVIRLTGACFSGGSNNCVADVDDGSSTGTRDGAVTLEDLLYYLSIYDQGVLAADVDNGTFTGTRDGGVTIDDLLYYLFRYDAGC